MIFFVNIKMSKEKWRELGVISQIAIAKLFQQKYYHLRGILRRPEISWTLNNDSQDAHRFRALVLIKAPSVNNDCAKVH